MASATSTTSIATAAICSSAATTNVASMSSRFVSTSPGPYFHYPFLCYRFGHHRGPVCPVLPPKSLRRFSSPKAISSSSSPSLESNGDVWRRENGELGFLERFRMGIATFRAVIPGGSWWNLEDIGRGEDKERQSTKSKVTLRFALVKMWELLTGDRWLLFAGFAALIVAALSDISIPNFLAASIFSAQNAETLHFQRNARMLVLLCIISGICSGLRGCCFGIANMVLVKRMREKLYSSLLCQDISFFDSETVGGLTSRLGADCQQVSRIIANDLNLISRDLLQATGALIILFSMSWRMALCILLICSALATIMIFYGGYQRSGAKLTQDFTASANEVAQETFSLIRTVRVYGTEKPEYLRYSKWLRSLADISVRQSFAYALWSSSLSSLYHSTQIVAVLVGGASVMAGHISAEQLTKFLLYSEWLIYSTWRLADNWSSMMQSVGASEKVFQMMDLLPSKEFSTKGSELQKLKGEINFIDISFSYSSRGSISALQNVNLVISPGEVLAIVGLSGSGKSTLVNLLLGLYHPTKGKILIDGCPMDDLDIKWLRERIGYVGQEPRLFRMDVSSNIRYGCTREVTDKDVEWAARQAFAHEFVMSLPRGYNTIVDDALLSGGQKQRIAIARAILRDPTILILDEATSALDADSEFYVKKIMHAVQSGSNIRRTVIVIAHRLSTIQAADRIVVMDNGVITEIGNHIDLLSRDGLYARLIRRQADAFS